MSWRWCIWPEWCVSLPHPLSPTLRAEKICGFPLACLSRPEWLLIECNGATIAIRGTAPCLWGAEHAVGTFGDRELSEILGDLGANQPNLWFPEPIWAASTHAAARWQVGCGANNQARDGICQGMPGPPVVLSRSNTPAFARGGPVNNHNCSPFLPLLSAKPTGLCNGNAWGAISKTAIITGQPLVEPAAQSFPERWMPESKSQTLYSRRR